MQFPFRLNNENRSLKTASKINNLIRTCLFYIIVIVFV